MRNKYDNIGTTCSVKDCDSIQFGEYDTCRVHTSHMKKRLKLLEFLDG